MNPQITHHQSCQSEQDMNSVSVLGLTEPTFRIALGGSTGQRSLLQIHHRDVHEQVPRDAYDQQSSL